MDMQAGVDRCERNVGEWGRCERVLIEFLELLILRERKKRDMQLGGEGVEGEWGRCEKMQWCTTLPASYIRHASVAV